MLVSPKATGGEGRLIRSVSAGLAPARGGSYLWKKYVFLYTCMVRRLYDLILQSKKLSFRDKLQLEQFRIVDPTG